MDICALLAQRLPTAIVTNTAMWLPGALASREAIPRTFGHPRRYTKEERTAP
jgi:hypothetical protein